MCRRWSVIHSLQSFLVSTFPAASDTASSSGSVSGYGSCPYLPPPQSFANSSSGSGLRIQFNRTTSPAAIVVIGSVAGVGMGNTFRPTLIAFLSHCTKAQRAVAISDRNFFRCLGGACSLAVSAAVLQAALRSNLPVGYKNLAHSTYSLPSRDGISDADWSSILNAYAAASMAIFILQVPLVGACFLLCVCLFEIGGWNCRKSQVRRNRIRRANQPATSHRAPLIRANLIQKEKTPMVARKPFE
ncbi:uncharacterized protein BDV17DRAFT_273099 [Aspergillus undulatus]|uniref:uncharacterized protein n=1 Tax=Aspergillus undulatus TaxID=1810928 RepID=UPI003CCDACC3